MSVDGDPDKALVANPPPIYEVAGQIKQWQSLGDVEVDNKGNGLLAYRRGNNPYEKGLYVMLIFEKITPGQHEGPEDVSKLMVECHGQLVGTKGAEAGKGLSIFPKK